MKKTNIEFVFQNLEIDEKEKTYSFDLKIQNSNKQYIEKYNESFIGVEKDVIEQSWKNNPIDLIKNKNILLMNLITNS